MGILQGVHFQLGAKTIMITSIGRWEIECEPERTADRYSELPLGSGCDCSDCRNFFSAIDLAFDTEFRELAESLGIDIRKPAELSHYGKEKSGPHYTGGWFHFVGHIRSGADAWTPRGENSWDQAFEKLNGKIELGFTNRVSLVRKPFEGDNLVQLEFGTRVPWVIEEPESP
jgi:hypothetical protein